MEFPLLTKNSTQVGTITSAVAPNVGDVVVLGLSGDNTGPWKVVSRQYLVNEWYLIVEPLPADEPVAMEYVKSQNG